ncbi:MAG: oligosaccharide flippase family protein, partial [Acetobacteraceae bacterium]
MYVLRFARTIILSRILSPHSLGAAIALMTILASCEMLTDVGLDRFVMISNRWMRGQTVAAAQQIAVARALLLGTAVIVLAPFLADVFDYQSLAPSIRWLGLLVFVTGFRNPRIYQIQQEYAYRPEAIASISGQA